MTYSKNLPQEMEHLTKSQSASRSNLQRLQEEEERRLSKQLKQQKRQRTNMFKEALKVRDAKDNPLSRKGHVMVEDDGRHGNGGDSGYMSLEREQIKEVDRWMGGWVGWWMDGWVGGWMGGWMGGLVDGWVGWWMDGWGF